MPAVVIRDCYQVVVQWQFQGANPMSNVLTFSGASATPLTQALADGLFSDVKAAFTSSGLNAHMNTATSLSGLTIKDIRTANGNKLQAAGAAVAGTGATDAYTAHAAHVATLRTNNTGKSYTGRIFTSGLLETDFDGNGFIINASSVIVVLFWNTFKTSASSRGLTLAVGSPALPERQNAQGVTLPAKADFSTPVTAIVTRNAVPGSQRHRVKRK